MLVNVPAKTAKPRTRGAFSLGRSVKIKVTSNTKQVLESHVRWQKQHRFAMAMALTKTAKAVQKGLYEEMRRQFDRPSPFTMRALFVTPATPAKLEADVRIKDRFPSGARITPDEVYRHQFYAGQRRRKGIEKFAQSAGLISGSEWLVPASGATLDAYGNMSRGQVQRIMSQLRLGLDAASFSSKSQRSRKGRIRHGRIFWSRGGHLRRGVWMVKGGDLMPLMLVVSSVRYRPRIDLEGVGNKIARDRLPAEIHAAVAYARRTAR